MRAAAYVFVRSDTNWSSRPSSLPATGRRSTCSAVPWHWRRHGAGRSGIITTRRRGGCGQRRSVRAQAARIGTQQAKLTRRRRGGDYFGYEVALSGDTRWSAILGDKAAGDAGSGMFLRSGTNWSQQAKLTASDGARGDSFGGSVALAATPHWRGTWSALAAGMKRAAVCVCAQRHQLEPAGQADRQRRRAFDHFGSSVRCGDTRCRGHGDDTVEGKMRQRVCVCAQRHGMEPAGRWPAGRV